MSLSRLIDRVLFGLVGILFLWMGCEMCCDIFVTNRGAEYFGEKPIRIVAVIGFAVWLSTFLLRCRDSDKDRQHQ